MMGVLKEGYLTKKGEKVKSWKRRYFQLRHDMVQLRFDYFRGKGGELLGTFYVKDRSSVRLLEPPTSPLPDLSVVEVNTPNRQYYFAGENEAESREWMWVIEKTLTFLSGGEAKSPQPTRASVRKMGYLFKKGGKRRNWKRRWFVLNGSILRYFRSEDKITDALGTIPLGECLSVHKITNYKGEETQRHMMSIDMPERTYFLAASNEHELEDWLRTLKRVGCNVVLTESTSNSTFYKAIPADSSDSEDDTAATAIGGLNLKDLADGGGDIVYNENGEPVAQPLRGKILRYGDIPGKGTFKTFAEMHAAFRPRTLVVNVAAPQ